MTRLLPVHITQQTQDYYEISDSTFIYHLILQVFDSKTAEVVTYHQVEIKQFYQQQG